MGIHVGCVITYEDELMILNKRYYTGRALDNRVGGFMIAEVARLLKESKTKYHLVCISVILYRKKWVYAVQK